MVLADLGRRINAAVGDFSSSSAADDSGIEAMLKEISNALLESDVHFQHVIKLRNSIKKQLAEQADASSRANKRKLIQKIVYDELVALVDTQAEPYKPKKNKSNVIMFVGTQGAGKTTSCTKLAVYYQRRKFKVGLVCADTFRAGAFDQLKQNATKAGIAFYGSYTENDPVKIARLGVEKFKEAKYEIIIVDTSGRHKQAEELFVEMQEIDDAVSPDQTILVLDATNGQKAQDHAKAFKEASNFGSIFLTKLDGAAKGGGAVSAVAATQTPIAFIGSGEHVQNIETFTPKQFIAKLLGIGDIQGLMEHVQSLDLDQKDTMKNFSEGKFTLNDFQTQIGNVMKMGPLSQIANMLPGGMGQLMNQVGEDETSKRIKRMLYIMDSMTKQELASDGKIFTEEPSRIIRVARGSGTSVTEVEMVLFQQRTMARMAQSTKGMMGGAGGMPGMPGAGAGGMANMAKNLTPGNIQRAMASMQNNPQMKQMMQGMMGGGGMPDMNEMMGMMQQPQMQQQMQGMMQNPQMMQNMMKQFGMG
ncbi:hypothetical protein BABINDRAFT_35905 [Babjeviella inositovora NRRL Y-12698]|uniref:Signal recognition particle 54 kDa protein n=1 Tax=Babjeviella inositovora NRRL Y-12698 TaxID=984486 RepID=A0A1E3QRL1_9ASCO|nr:uncharacterized protein BABINDRAFT_35905 [Babjeviella inositovora NRRL Y-12698]ODQ80335.1 hypothetical protein BABINDRAFT_35905 [Babjeviella inositovora NRRL Y-12698]